MTYYVKSNNSDSLITDNPLTAGALTLNVTTGEGSNFPSTFPYILTIWNDSLYPDPGNDSGMELVRCTGRTADALTIVRAQEGTSGVEHSQGEAVSLLVTAGLFNDATYGIEGNIDTHTADSDAHHNESHDIDSHTGTSLTIDDLLESTLDHGIDIESVHVEDGELLLSNNKNITFGDSNWQLGKILTPAGAELVTASAVTIKTATASTQGFFIKNSNNTPMLEVNANGIMQVKGNIQGDVISQEHSFNLGANLLDIMTDPRYLCLMTDDPTGTIHDYSSKGHTGSTVGSMTSGDQVYKGLGYNYDFDNLDDGIIVPDHADFTFGDGTNDSAFTMGIFFQVIASSVHHVMMAKTEAVAANREWLMYLMSYERLRMYLIDESASKSIYRESSTLAAGYYWGVVTYDGRGGADAADGINVYINGILDNYDKLNNAGYVAMEPLAADLTVGIRAHGAGYDSPFYGDLGVSFVDASEWSAADVWRSYLLIKGAYNL